MKLLLQFSFVLTILSLFVNCDVKKTRIDHELSFAAKIHIFFMHLIGKSEVLETPSARSANKIQTMREDHMHSWKSQEHLKELKLVDELIELENSRDAN